MHLQHRGNPVELAVLADHAAIHKLLAIFPDWPPAPNNLSRVLGVSPPLLATGAPRDTVNYQPAGQIRSTWRGQAVEVFLWFLKAAAESWIQQFPTLVYGFEPFHAFGFQGPIAIKVSRGNGQPADRVAGAIDRLKRLY